MLSALIPSEHSYSAMPLARQLIHQRFVLSGPLVLGKTSLKILRLWQIKTNLSHAYTHLLPSVWTIPLSHITHTGHQPFMEGSMLPSVRPKSNKSLRVKHINFYILDSLGISHKMQVDDFIDFTDISWFFNPDYSGRPPCVLECLGFFVDGLNPARVPL